MNSICEANVRDDTLVWEYYLRTIGTQETRRYNFHLKPNILEPYTSCMEIYWEMFASQRLKACTVFTAIQLLQRILQTCEDEGLVLEAKQCYVIAASCAWLASKVVEGQNAAVGAHQFAFYWNENTLHRYQMVRAYKMKKAEMKVLVKLEFQVMGFTALDVFMTLLRLHCRTLSENEANMFFKHAVELLIGITLSTESLLQGVLGGASSVQLALALAKVLNFQVDEKYGQLVNTTEGQRTVAWLEVFIVQ